MNKRLLSVVIFAVLVSGAVSFVIYRLVSARLAAGARGPAKTILVAAHPLAMGSLVRDADVKTVDWTGSLPPQTLLRREDAVGRGVVAAIYEDEPMVDSRLAPKGGGAGLAAMIPKGMRAVAVRVNEVVGVAGFVLPGMRVDVLISGNAPGQQNTLGTQTKTVLQNILVLSAGQNIQTDAEGKPVTVPVVNLGVTPEQAEVLSLASNDTRIQLVLRNPLDNEEAKPPGTALARLFGVPPPPPVKPRPRAPAPVKPVVTADRVAPPPPPPAPQFKIVEVLHGTKRAEAKFQKTVEVDQ
jgi:pilus assembly protein CpaB